MGYTHYFPHAKTTKKKWAKILTDCKTLLEKLPKNIIIRGWDGGGEPVFNDEKISYNGNADNDLDHETFELLRDGAQPEDYEADKKVGFRFCKTAYKPYDLLVCACLLVYKHHSPDTLELGSDGDPEDWKASEEFVKDVLGYSVRFKRDPEKFVYK
jgi:hypothetical protein